MLQRINISQTIEQSSLSNYFYSVTTWNKETAITTFLLILMNGNGVVVVDVDVVNKNLLWLSPKCQSSLFMAY